MNKLAVGSIATLAVLLSVASAPAATVAKNDWQVVATYKPEGTKVCSLRFPVPKGSPTLSLENRKVKKSNREEAFLTLGTLPPILAGKKGVIRDIVLTIDGWSVTGIKGDWAHGSKDNNSRISFHADQPMSAVIPPLGTGAKLTITLPDAAGGHAVEFDLAGSAEPVALLTSCLNGR